MSENASKRFFEFHSDALEDDDLLVVKLEGEEAISRPFRFELELVSKSADLDYDEILEQSCWVGLRKGIRLAEGRKGLVTLKIHGVIASLRQIERRFEWTKYHVVLVPRLWRGAMTVQSRIFLDQSIPEIVEEVLKSSGFTDLDYEMRLAADYEPREYTVQYRESDLDFLSRLLEHAGIFYYFEHGEEGEKIVFADSTAAYQPVWSDSVFTYRPELETPDQTPDGPTGVQDLHRDEQVHFFECQQRTVPREVVLRDYNWRQPTQDLTASAEVHPRGTGTVYLYGEHYPTKAAGEALARIRAEEIACRRKVFLGRGDARTFRIGMTWTLEEHYRHDFNAEYLLTSIAHHGTQSIELATSAAMGATYINEFECISTELVYRPERVTRRPRVEGTLNATVDAGGSGEYAEIDDEGRYKVKLPFDRSDRSGGKASRFIRMAQPYAGGGMGMHFPLHKGTEVILTHVNGDPDRPIIAAAVPNPDTTSPVCGGNSSQCAIHTGGGNQITIEDTAGGQRIHLSSPTSGTSFSIGAPE